MRRWQFAAAAMILALTTALVGQNSATRDAEAQMNLAAQRVLRDSDTKGAIDTYRKIVANTAISDAVRARAQLEIARLDERLGSAEARKEYQLVVTKFPKQEDAVREARAHLGAAPGTSPAQSFRVVREDVDDFPTPNAPLMEMNSGAVSPDGKYLCGNADTTKGNYLLIVDLAAKSDRILLNAPKADSSEGCRFSPAGDQVAYPWHDEHAEHWELRVVSLAGAAPPRTLMTSDSESYDTLAWTVDGKSLAVRVVNGQTGADRVELVSLLDHSSRPLTSRVDGRMFFSPDGRFLAFDRPMREGSCSRDVFVLTLDSKNESNVTQFPSDDAVMGWSPDSKQVLFVSDRGGSTALYSVSVLDGRPQGAPVIRHSDIGSADPMGVTRNGTFYFTRRTGGASSFLQVVPLDLKGARYLADPISLGPVGRNAALGWSPDGRYLAYFKPMARGCSTARSLQLWNRDTAIAHEVDTKRLSYATQLTWASDGHSIAISSMGAVSEIGVATEPADVRPLANDLFGTGGLAWSADKSKLYYSRTQARVAGQPLGIIERDVASGSERVIVPFSSRASRWQLSPDKRSVALMVDDSATGTTALMLVPLDGSAPRELVRRPKLGVVNFSPDSRYIETRVIDPATDKTDVLVVPVDGGDARAVATGPSPRAISGVMWAPDSSILLYRKVDSTTGGDELWRVTIDGRDVKRFDGVLNLSQLQSMELSRAGTLAFVRGDGSDQATTQVIALDNFLPATVRK
jgi:Tol biopolymer transport system component